MTPGIKVLLNELASMLDALQAFHDISWDVVSGRLASKHSGRLETLTDELCSAMVC